MMFGDRVITRCCVYVLHTVCMSASTSTTQGTCVLVPTPVRVYLIPNKTTQQTTLMTFHPCRHSIDGPPMVSL